MQQKPKLEPQPVQWGQRGRPDDSQQNQDKPDCEPPYGMGMTKQKANSADENAHAAQCHAESAVRGADHVFVANQILVQHGIALLSQWPAQVRANAPSGPRPDALGWAGACARGQVQAHKGPRIHSSLAPFEASSLTTSAA